MSLNQPRSIESARPFAATARKYVEKGWGILPLPERRKEWPPSGLTGRAGRFATEQDLLEWLNPNGAYPKGNIAIRVGNRLEDNGIGYEVIGIDVDAYSGKHGKRDLARLEQEHGPLPDTWTSSSRDDGVSGIRFYRVPYGFGFRGQATDSIDIIQRVHRYAVVWPSWHPDTKAQYCWYEPGFPPDGQHFASDVPEAITLPLLPDSWIDLLTKGRQLDSEGYGIDLDASNDEIKAWMRKNFNKPLPDTPGGMCDVMAKAVGTHIEKIEASASNHNLITAAHWHLLSLATEGHSGHKAAIAEVEAVWKKDIAAKGKRSESMVVREIGRSMWGSLRKLKAKADSFAEQGFSIFCSELCMDVKEIAGEMNPESDIPHWIGKVELNFRDFDPADYDCVDFDQAKHFHDRVNDNVRFLDDYNAWLIYDGKTWRIDESGWIRDLFNRACIETSTKRIGGLISRLEKHIKSGGAIDDSTGKPLNNKIKKLNKIRETYRNDNKIKAMLNCMKARPGISGMKFSDLNSDTTILAMPGGKCLRLDEKQRRNAKGFKVIENQKEFYATMKTGVDYLEWKDISQHEKTLWLNYLDLFLPDLEYRKFVQKALGHMLIGGNPAKKAVFLVGKSNTGKSTMIQALQSALGDYGETFTPSALFRDSNSGMNPELGNLLHRRAIFSSEAGSTRIYANPFKRHTGNDKVSITRKFANNQIIQSPHFTMCVATNLAPTIEDADEATVKRILVLPLETQVSSAKDDKRADVELARDARHAVLNWLIHGYRRYVREGLDWDSWHDLSKAATLEFTSELSDVSTFLHELCIVADEDMKRYLNSDVISDEHQNARKEWSKISQPNLYQKHVDECNTISQKPMTPRIFAKKVKQVFAVDTIMSRHGDKPVRCYLGLKWKNEQAMVQIQ